MTTVSLIMMVIAILVVWGGLAVSIRYLVRHPLEDQEEDAGELYQHEL